jgi:hypothetical protein
MNCSTNYVPGSYLDLYVYKIWEAGSELEILEFCRVLLQNEAELGKFSQDLAQPLACPPAILSGLAGAYIHAHRHSFKSKFTDISTKSTHLAAPTPPCPILWSPLGGHCLERCLSLEGGSVPFGKETRSQVYEVLPKGSHKL